jgi:hypothetical protein
VLLLVPVLGAPLHAAGASYRRLARRLERLRPASSTTRHRTSTTWRTSVARSPASCSACCIGCSRSSGSAR